MSADTPQAPTTATVIDDRFRVQRVNDIWPVKLELLDHAEARSFYTGLLGKDAARQLGNALIRAADDAHPDPT